MTERLLPGERVRHPAEPDWGIGQIQSVIGTRVTVNFEHAGKVVINAAVIRLEPVDGGQRR
jgi:FKBP-type peptidyl-prolyl cis-trans isomerase 2